jgi:hypothetical protein
VGPVYTGRSGRVTLEGANECEAWLVVTLLRLWCYSIEHRTYPNAVCFIVCYVCVPIRLPKVRANPQPSCQFSNSLSPPPPPLATIVRYHSIVTPALEFIKVLPHPFLLKLQHIAINFIFAPNSQYIARVRPHQTALGISDETGSFYGTQDTSIRRLIAFCIPSTFLESTLCQREATLW